MRAKVAENQQLQQDSAEDIAFYLDAIKDDPVLWAARNNELVFRVQWLHALWTGHIRRQTRLMQPVSTCEQSCTECHGYARIPYPRCRNCWDAPCYHHDRCCPKRCWVCRKYAGVPFESCDYCGDKPSNHHGRCCSQHPANRNHLFEWSPSC